MKKIFIIMVLSISSLPCFGMGRASQRVNQWISQRIQTAWNKVYPPKQISISNKHLLESLPEYKGLSEYKKWELEWAVGEDIKLKNASDKLVKEAEAQRKVYDNLERSYFKKPLYKRLLFGNRYSDASFNKYMQDRRAARDNARSLTNEYENVELNRAILKSRMDSLVPGQTLIKESNPDFRKFIY